MGLEKYLTAGRRSKTTGPNGEFCSGIPEMEPFDRLVNQLFGPGPLSRRGNGALSVLSPAIPSGFGEGRDNNRILAPDLDPNNEDAATAVHEAGHVVVYWALDPELPLAAALQSSNKGSATYDAEICSRLPLRQQLMKDVAGTLAESKFLTGEWGRVFGAGSDLDKAAHRLRCYALKNPGWTGRNMPMTYASEAWHHPATYAAREEAQEILSDRWGDVERLACELLDKRELTRADIVRILG